MLMNLLEVGMKNLLDAGNFFGGVQGGGFEIRVDLF